MTTHYMEEANTLCDEIAIMNKGKIIAQGAPDVLLKQHFDGVTLELPKVDFRVSEKKSDPKWRVIERNDLVEIYTNQVEDSIRSLLESGVSLKHLKIRSQSLEDLFLQLTSSEANL